MYAISNHVSILPFLFFFCCSFALRIYYCDSNNTSKNRGGQETRLIEVYLILTSDKLGDPISLLVGLHRGRPGEGMG